MEYYVTGDCRIILSCNCITTGNKNSVKWPRESLLKGELSLTQ